MSVLVHTRALCWKNWVLKKRAWCSTFLEIAIPAAMLFLFAYIKSLTTPYWSSPSWFDDNYSRSLDSCMTSSSRTFAVVGNGSTYFADFLATNYPSRAIVTPFASEAALNTYLAADTYGDAANPVLDAAVLFSTFDIAGAQFDYVIRTNVSYFYVDGGWSKLNTPDTRLSPVSRFTSYSYMRDADFACAQFLVDQSILRAVYPQLVNSAITYDAFPLPAKLNDDFLELAKYVIGMLFAVAMVWPLSRILRSLIEEKEHRIREGMLMMGLKHSSLWLSWFITYLVIFAATLGACAGAVALLFPRSDVSLLLLVMFEFMVAIFAFALLVSVFFTRATLGSVAGVLLHLGLAALYYATTEASDRQTKLLYCLSAPACMSQVVVLFAKFESTGRGLGWSAFTEQIEGLSIGDCALMMLADIALYFTLGAYFDLVLPRAYGTPRKWYFCVTRQFFCPARAAANGEPSAEPFDDIGDIGERLASSGDIQPLSGELQRRGGISIRGLVKEFTARGGETVRAVNGVDMDMVDGQIFSLLGHNGAGKTTLLNCLTGMTGPSKGSLSVYGLDVESKLDSVRSMMGVCPQHDTLLPKLTVSEHLQLFARIKGVPSENIEAAVNESLVSMQLTEKAHALSHTLSGGQMRRLSVAIALIGGSKVVYLDEPTAGMDPEARRLVWDCLKGSKKDRVIILVTHFMDEADELGDRIAIMAHGQLRCCGTSLFLKNALGVGYTLTVSLALSSNPEDLPVSRVQQGDAVFNLIRHHVPAAQIVSQAAGEVQCRLPFDASAQFSQLFFALDDAKAQRALPVASYGVSVTTLEEVFLRINADSGGLKKAVVAGKQTDSDPLSPTTAAIFDVDPSMALAEPLLGVGDLQLEVRSEQAAPELDALFAEASIATSTQVCHRQCCALLTKRARITRRDPKQVVMQTVLPVVIMALSLLLMLAPGPTVYPELVVTPRGLGLPSSLLPARLPYNACPQVVTNASLPDCTGTALARATVDAFAAVQIGSADLYWQSLSGHTNTSIRYPFSMYSFLQSTLNAAPRTGAAVVRQLPGVDSAVRFQASLLVNSSLLFGLTLVQNSLSTAALAHLHTLASASSASASASASSTSTSGTVVPRITVRTRPFIKRIYSSARSVEESTVVLTIVPAVCLLLSLLIGSPAVVAYVVQEKASRAKQLQFISGARPHLFWLANWLWDSVYALSALAIILAVACIQPLPWLQKSEAWPAMLMLLIAYTPASMSAAYLFSTPFTAPSSALALKLVTNILFAGVGPLSVYAARALSEEGSVWVALFENLMRAHPAFCLGYGTLNVAINIIVFPTGRPPSEVNWTAMRYVRDECIALAFMACACMALVLLVEHMSVTGGCSRRRLQAQPGHAEGDVGGGLPNEDVDVRAERERIEAGVTDRFAVVLKGLHKVFSGRGRRAPPKVAVQKLYFAVPEGECFGFLGVNGSGKSTTLKILSGEQRPTSGTASLNGFDVVDEQAAVRSAFGYCPQFDALSPLLSAREHLELYAALKLAPRSRMGGYVDKMLTRLDLTKYADRQSGTYSGGNKRKLSVGIALVGGPRVVALDEPSTGIDPLARRGLWKLISSTMQRRAVILTTHSMEECEALCQRIAILVSGALVCIGSAQHLKHRFGNGVLLHIKLAAGATTALLEARLRESFPEAVVSTTEQHDGNVECRLVPSNGAPATAVSPSAASALVSAAAVAPVPAEGATFSLGRIFAALEDSKQSGLLEAYSVSETTLEQIFIAFAGAAGAAEEP